MSYINTKLLELKKYLPHLTKREDFDEFWEKTLENMNKQPLMPEKEKINYPCPYVDVYKIKYAGYEGTIIHGWYIVPNFIKKEKLPCLIHYHGYLGNKGYPSDFLKWSMMGIAVISIDLRDQSGETGNNLQYTHGSMQSVVTKGLLNKEEYYYKAVYIDCIKALDFAFIQKEIDKDNIIIEGSSQGGALVMAVAALDNRPTVALADVPSNSNIEKRIEERHGSYSAVTNYLKENPQYTDKVFETLSYFDTMNMADKITCKILASVALKDNICPAQCYFATYNRITSEKEIRIYPFNEHEGGKSIQEEEKLVFIKNEVATIF